MKARRHRLSPAGAGANLLTPSWSTILLTSLLVAAVVLIRPVRASGATPIANGLIAFQGWKDGSMQIYTVATDGSNLKRLTTGGSNYTPKWSPDGRRIAYMGPGRAIWVMDADGSDGRQVSKGDGGYPTWSPDGQYIAFESRRDGNPELYMARSDGTGDDVRLTDSPWQDVTPAWSPDGAQIAFSSERSGILQVHLMTTTPDHSVTLVSRSTVTQYDPTWSPDGLKIAFTSSPPSGEGMGIFVVNRTGGAVTQLTDTVKASAHEASWAPDGTMICYSGRAPGQEITIMNSDGSNPRVVNTQDVSPLVPDWQPLRLPSVTLRPPIVGATSVFIDGTATPADGTVTITAVTWDWGDGTVGQGAFPQSHQYKAPGQYRVQVAVRQSDGLVSAASISINILAFPHRGTAPVVARDAQ